MFRFTENKYVLPIGLGTIAAIVVGAIAANTSKPETASTPLATPTPTVTVTATATATATPTPKNTREAEKAQGFMKAIAKSFEPSKPKVYKIGDEIETRGRKINVTNILQYPNGLSSGNEFIDSLPGRIIVVPMSATNTSDETGNMTFSRFLLRDSQGRTYTEINNITETSWRRNHRIATRGTDMFPGETRADAALFKVAPDADGFSMEWNGNNIELTTVDPKLDPTPSAPTASDTKSHAFAMTIKGRDYATHVNLRSEPNTQSSVVAEVHTGDSAEYINESTNNTGEHWYKVRVNSNVGWIYEDLVSRDSRN